MSITYYGIIVGLLLTIAWATGDSLSSPPSSWVRSADLVDAQIDGKIDMRAMFTNRGRG
ncbi:MAG: hypothetical protein U1U88_000794 [Lawsonella clevelandensis]